FACLYFFFFFFSSRRRHTRLQGDWSSDVCSSDLHLLGNADGGGRSLVGLCLFVEAAAFFGRRGQVTVLEFREQLALLDVIAATEDRKSTRLNSSHLVISYAVFCLKKKNTPLCDTY